MLSAEHELITGVWGSPPSGYTGRPVVEGWGAKHPEAGSFLAPEHSTEPQNLPRFRYFAVILLPIDYCA